ncbi:hypothetical protein HK405_003489 [Cladochytrium tenue]|nr:hypothetical protein HK405_003489 [Cladochytrium tenue]
MPVLTRPHATDRHGASRAARAARTARTAHKSSAAAITSATTTPTSSTVASVRASPPALPAARRTRTPAQLPPELHLAILSFAPTPAVLQFRLASRASRAIADAVLGSRTAVAAAQLGERRSVAEDRLAAAEAEWLPLLRHYAGFLGGSGGATTAVADAAEAAWYASPPDELKTVCECMCILHLGDGGGGNESPMAWAAIRKHMARYDFRSWLSNLRTRVSGIAPGAVRRVEAVIVSNAAITYERLRDVSTPGYKLLIVVAACLQHARAAGELRARRGETEAARRLAERMEAFRGALERRAPRPRDYGVVSTSMVAAAASSAGINFAALPAAAMAPPPRAT